MWPLSRDLVWQDQSFGGVNTNWRISPCDLGKVPSSVGSIVIGEMGYPGQDGCESGLELWLWPQGEECSVGGDLPLAQNWTFFYRIMMRSQMPPPTGHT